MWAYARQRKSKRIWKADFDFLYQRMGEGVFTLTMHPQVIGRGHRILMLERMIEYLMKGHEGVKVQNHEWTWPKSGNAPIRSAKRNHKKGDRQLRQRLPH